jgi:hypothetical protein
MKFQAKITICSTQGLINIPFAQDIDLPTRSRISLTASFLS